MIQGAIIGLIIAIVMVIIKKNQEKKALAKVSGEDIIDQPDFAAFFHYASEATFNKKGIKFFDNNGVLTLNGSMLNYQPQLKGQSGLSVDLNNVKVILAPEKRKMKWVEIEDNGTKHYLTSFSQGAFSVDKTKMNEFLIKLKELKSDL